MRHHALRAEQTVFVGEEKRRAGVEYRPRQSVIYRVRFDRRCRIGAPAGLIRPCDEMQTLGQRGVRSGQAVERDALGF